MGAIPPLEAASFKWPAGCVPIEGGVCAPAGFTAAGVAAGIKKSEKPDVAILAADAPAVSAGVFTTNAFAAPCVHLTRTHVAKNPLKAIVVNAGNANACTGPGGMEDTVEMAMRAAELLGCTAWEVGVASTGVIGVPLPMDKVRAGIHEAHAALSSGGAQAAALAITTTDTFSKEIAVECTIGLRKVRIGGMAKGSGMIQPNMATMLAFFTTDAALDPAQAKALLEIAAGRSFNRITVDGETSTNDMALLMASGASGVRFPTDSMEEMVFFMALSAACSFLAQQIVRDGEGATKVCAVKVEGAADEAQTEAVARAVANSPLFKCALFGEDANWGRVLSAAGASGVAFEPDKVSVRFGQHLVAQAGGRADFDEEALSAYLKGQELEVTVSLGLGSASATVWTTDLSYEYVKINAEYRT